MTTSVARHPPALQVLRELGIDLPSAIPEHAAGQSFVVFPDDGSTPCLLPYGDGTLGYSCRHQALVEDAAPFWRLAPGWVTLPQFHQRIIHHGR